MDINRQNMDALFATYNTAFSAGMQSAGGRPTPEDLIADEIAMLAPSTGASTTHAWLGQIGGMREWVGPRILANIESGKLSVVNRSFEKTVTVPRTSIEDDQYGVYTPLIGALGVVGGSLWLRLVVDAYLANGNWADGKKFFVADRKYGGNTINNITTAALSGDTFKAAKTAMQSFVLHGDEPGEVVPKYLVVGPGLRDTAWEIVKGEWVSSGTGKGGSIRNAQQGACELRVCRRFVGAHAQKWLVTGEQAGIKSAYVQKRKEPVLTRMDRDGDENVFMRNEYYYGTDARGEAFLTLPHLAYLGNVAA